jgi:hypothetical protein
MKHEIASSTLHSATCTCGHIERSTIQYAALEVYLRDHIAQGNDIPTEPERTGTP